MDKKKELQLAYILIGVMLFVGVICYAAAPGKPEEPVRLAMKNMAGKVIFDHKGHTEGTKCSDCHHHPGNDSEEVRKCGDCHFAEEVKTVPDVCKECHKDIDEEHHDSGRLCNECHFSQSPTTVPDACKECHEDLREEHHDEGRECNECHSVDKGESLPAACADCHDEPSDIEGEAKIMSHIKMDMQLRTDSYHNQCENCHKADQNKLIGPKDKNERCRWCHTN